MNLDLWPNPPVDAKEFLTSVYAQVLTGCTRGVSTKASVTSSALGRSWDGYWTGVRQRQARALNEGDGCHLKGWLRQAQIGVR